MTTLVSRSAGSIGLRAGLRRPGRKSSYHHRRVWLFRACRGCDTGNRRTAVLRRHDTADRRGVWVSNRLGRRTILGRLCRRSDCRRNLNDTDLPAKLNKIGQSRFRCPGCCIQLCELRQNSLDPSRDRIIQSDPDADRVCVDQRMSPTVANAVGYIFDDLRGFPRSDRRQEGTWWYGPRAQFLINRHRIRRPYDRIFAVRLVRYRGSQDSGSQPGNGVVRRTWWMGERLLDRGFKLRCCCFQFSLQFNAFDYGRKCALRLHQALHHSSSIQVRVSQSN